MILRKLIVITLTIFTSLTASNTYYIDFTRGSDQNSGKSYTTPWKTIEKLNRSWNQMAPGDSILLKKGESWAPYVNAAVIQIPESGLHGNKDNHIYIGAYGEGRKPVISAENSLGKTAFFASNISYVEINGIDFRGELRFYGSLENRNSKITYLRLLNLELNGRSGGKTTGCAIDFYAEAVEQSAENWQQSEMHNIEIGYCAIRNTYPAKSSAIQIYGQGNNYVHNNKIYNAERSGINFAEGDNNTIVNNLVSGTKGPGIKHSVHSHTANNVRIKNNLLLNNKQGGIAVYNLRFSEICGNTVYVKGNEAAIFGWTTQSPVPISGKGKTGFDDNLICSNVFYGGPVYLWKADNVKITYIDGQEVNYYQPDIWENNRFENNYYFNPDSKQRLYVRSFTEGTHVFSDPSRAGGYKSALKWTDYYINQDELNSEWLTKKNVKGDKFENPGFEEVYWNSPEDFGGFDVTKTIDNPPANNNSENEEPMLFDSENGDSVFYIEHTPGYFGSSVNFFLDEASTVEILVYDAEGNKAEVICSEKRGRGHNFVNWKTEKLGSGIYYIVFRALPIKKGSATVEYVRKSLILR